MTVKQSRQNQALTGIHTMRTGVLTAAERSPSVCESFRSCCVTRLVGMPRLFAMIAEQCPAARPLTCQLWTTRTARRYHHIPTIHTK